MKEKIYRDNLYFYRRYDSNVHILDGLAEKNS